MLICRAFSLRRSEATSVAFACFVKTGLLFSFRRQGRVFLFALVFISRPRRPTADGFFVKSSARAGFFICSRFYLAPPPPDRRRFFRQIVGKGGFFSFLSFSLSSPPPDLQMRYCSNIYKGGIFSVFRKNRKKIIANSAKICYTDLAVKRNGLMVKRLRRRPLTAETGVRFPVGLPDRNYPNTTITQQWIRVVFLLPKRERAFFRRVLN